MSKLIVYGLPFSQPVRAVVWALLLKEQPFEMKLINPGHSGKGGSRHPDFLAKSVGPFPVLKRQTADLLWVRRTRF